MGNRVSEVSSVSDMDKNTRVVGDYENNGLILRGYPLPEEIILEILNKLPPKDILKCRLVCERWSNIIDYLILNLYNKKYNTRHTEDILPFDVRYITLYGNVYNKNLLKNVNGQDKLKHWTIIEDGGDRLRIEDPPQGSDPLPADIEEFQGHTSCFVSSFCLAKKQQIIDLKKDKHLSLIINKYKPHIYVSEWVAARFDCGAKYEMSLCMQCRNGTIIQDRVKHRIEQWEGSPWKKVEFTIEEYPDDVELIIFEHKAKDMQYWKGHYGMKMAGAVVKLLLHKIKL